MPILYPYTQYGGIWKLNAASAAQGAGTWATPPAPHLFSWGENARGQLALSNTKNYSSPKQVGSLTSWLVLTGGYSCGLGVKTDGTLWSWGYNANGQLGLGNTSQYSSPKQVGSLTNWSSVSTCMGSQISAAIKTNGTLWTWGSGLRGQTGLGNTTYYSSPKQVGSLTNWLQVSCGNYHTMAVKTDGTLWSWGDNGVAGGATIYGQLGLNNTTHYVSSPTQVGSLTNWLFVSAGAYHTIAVKTNNTLWSWGFNAQGQLGLGNTTKYSSPKQVGSLTNWLKVSAGGYSGVAIKTDGTLWSWGYNSNGQLGLGNTTGYSSPKQVGSLTNWSLISSAMDFTASIKTDGTLFAWGRNYGGQLGLGNITYYSSPKQVGLLTTWSNFACGRSHTFGIATT